MSAHQLKATVTWLMPVKNGMPYLPETLASIKAQTFRDWEIIVWDNGSTDGTLKELRKWIPHILPGRIVESEPLSLGNSLARLVESAETELCARIDADDINYPERLTKQVAFMNAHPEVGLLGTQIEFIDENSRAVAGAWRQDCEDAEIRWRMRWQGSVTHSTAVFRRSIVLAAGNYTDSMPCEDHDLWLRMSRITEVANLPNVLVKYRLSEKSVTSRMVERRYDDLADRAAERNAAILFAETRPKDAMELRLKAMGRLREQLSWRDVFKLRRAANATAKALGKPRKYFISTARYRLQRECLITGVRFGTTYIACEQKLRHFFRDRSLRNGSGKESLRLATVNKL